MEKASRARRKGAGPSIVAVCGAASRGVIRFGSRVRWELNKSRLLDAQDCSQRLEQASQRALSAAGDEAAVTRQLVSFDIFDTLITRSWFQPTDLFIEAGRRLVEHGFVAGSAENWAEERITVEAQLRAAPVEEVTLDEIYEALGLRMGWDHHQLTRARDLELACEFEAVRPISSNVDYYNNLRATGTDVILISDTYFDKASIMTMLRACGIDIEPKRVYISSELHASKRTGRLFEHVTQHLRARGTIAHIGDNCHSDVRAAAAAGVSPIYFASSRATRYESAFYGMAGYPLAMRSALAGSARATRLQGRCSDAHLRAVWDTAADVGGPVLFGFVLWLLCEAKRRGIARLYFVARDGQILLRIAKTIVAKMAWPIECRYLHGSRQAWHLPALRQIDNESLNWILNDHCLTSIRDHLAKVELEPDTCGDVLSRYGFFPASWDDYISDDRRPHLHQVFCDPDLQTKVLTRAAECREVALDYLRMAGVLDGGAIGIVDIGWHGRLQVSLSRLLRSAGRSDRGGLTGFYLGLLKRPDPMAGELHSFLDDADPPLPARIVNPSLLEVFCAADHGSVRGYRRVSESRVEPVLYASSNDLALRWGLVAQQEAIAAFSTAMIDAIATDSTDPSRWMSLLRVAAMRALTLFTRAPSREEADVFGRFQHATHQTHARAADLAPRLPLAKRWLTAAVPCSVRYEGFWLEGSMRRSATPSIVELAPFALFSLRRALVNRILVYHGAS
jgi:predicted HAD superfamily hydrolase